MNSIILSAVLPAIQQVATSLLLLVGALLSIALALFGVAKLAAMFSPGIDRGLNMLLTELTDTVRDRAGFEKNLDLPEIDRLPASVKSNSQDQFSDIEANSMSNDFPQIDFPDLDSSDDAGDFADTLPPQFADCDADDLMEYEPGKYRLTPEALKRKLAETDDEFNESWSEYEESDNYGM